MIKFKIAAKDIKRWLQQMERLWTKIFSSILHQLEILDGTKLGYCPEIEKLHALDSKVETNFNRGDPWSWPHKYLMETICFGFRGYIQYLRYYYFIKHADVVWLIGTNLVYITRSCRWFIFIFSWLSFRKTWSTFLLVQNCWSSSVFFWIFPIREGAWRIAWSKWWKNRLFLGSDDQEWTTRDFEYAQ